MQHNLRPLPSPEAPTWFPDKEKDLRHTHFSQPIYTICGKIIIPSFFQHIFI